jgi:hypothetical protein
VLGKAEAKACPLSRTPAAGMINLCPAEGIYCLHVEPAMFLAAIYQETIYLIPPILTVFEGDVIEKLHFLPKYSFISPIQQLPCDLEGTEYGTSSSGSILFSFFTDSFRACKSYVALELE